MISDAIHQVSGISEIGLDIFPGDGQANSDGRWSRPVTGLSFDLGAQIDVPRDFAVASVDWREVGAVLYVGHDETSFGGVTAPKVVDGGGIGNGPAAGRAG